MDARLRSTLEDEIEQYDILIKASEAWGSGFSADPITHGKLIRNEAKYARALRGMFRQYANKIDKYFNPYAYDGLVHADYTVDVTVNDQLYEDMDGTMITISLENLSTSVALGAQAGEAIYNIPLGIRSTDATIQRLTTEQVAKLVGKRVDKDGNIVDNPRPEYKISDKTRADINASIRTSIAMGEDRNAAIARLMGVINNPKRADLIAQTESVNAFSNGHLQFAVQSGATGKEWQDVAAKDICGVYASYSTVPIDYDYNGHGLNGPAAHPGCRCSLRLTYLNEFNPATFKDPAPAPIPEPKPTPKPKPKPTIPYTLNPARQRYGNVEVDQIAKEYSMTKREVEFAKTTGLDFVKRDMTVSERRYYRISKGTQAFYVPSKHFIWLLTDQHAGDTPRTFYHEFGHSVDHRFTTGVLTKAGAVAALRKDSLGIAMDRIRDMKPDLNPEQIESYAKTGWYSKALPDGRTTIVGPGKSYHTYLKSRSELFADAYGQYRTKPKEFAKYAPNVYALFKEIGL